MAMSSFDGKNVLVTGGAGFIGAHLARRLSDLGGNVHIVDSFNPLQGANIANLKGLEEKVKLYEMGVDDFCEKKTDILRRQDYIFNLAGQSSHMDSMSHPFFDLDSNISAQLSLLEACRHENRRVRIVFASTRQLYGVPLYVPVDERHPVAPVDINGIHKFAAEQYHRLYCRLYGIESTILRLTNTYGPGMRIKDARQNFLGIWIRLLLEEKPLEIWGGEQMRDFTYVDDCVDAFMAVALSKESVGKIYNLGGATLNLKELAALMLSIVGCGSLIVKDFPEERKGIDIGSFFSSDDFIRLSLGWQPRVSLQEGLEKTLSYFEENYDYYV